MNNEQKNLFFEILLNALSAQGISYQQHQLESLFLHLSLLRTWQKAHNLTAILTLQGVVFDHYVDCIKGLSFLSLPQTVFDFGSGGGFPGIVAAVLNPNTFFVLVETSRKKASFLRVAVKEMGLQNVEVAQTRVEKLAPVEFAISRATFSPSFLPVAANAIKQNGHLALWVGSSSEFALKAEMPLCALSLERHFIYEWLGISPREIWLLKKT